MNARAFAAMKKRVRRFEAEKKRLTRGWEFISEKARVDIVSRLQELSNHVFGDLERRTQSSLDLELLARRKSSRKVVNDFFRSIVDDMLYHPKRTFFHEGAQEASATMAAAEYFFRKRHLREGEPSEELAWWTAFAKREFLITCHTEPANLIHDPRPRTRSRGESGVYSFATHAKIQEPSQ